MNKICVGSPEKLEEKLKKDLYGLKEQDFLQPIKLVVPSNLVGIYLRRALVCRGLSHANIEFCTFADLLQEITDFFAARSQKKSLPFYGEERVISMITENITPNSYFAPVSTYKGFQKALKQTFQELRAGGAEDYLQSLEGWKGEELRRLFHNYQHLLKDYAVSWATSGQNDCINIDDEEYSLPVIFIFGIYKLNNLQKELLKKLVSSTTVFIYIPDYLPNGDNRTKILHWLEELDLPREEVGKSHGESLLKSLQSNIGHVFFPVPFAKNTKKVKKNMLKQTHFSINNDNNEDNSLEVWSAPNEVKEVQEIGRKITDFAQAGYQLREMAVLVNGTHYNSLLGEIFNSLGLPYYLPAEISLDSTRTGRGLLMCLQLCYSSWTRREVTDLLHFAPFDYGRIMPGEKEPVVSLWDYLTLKAGITSGREEWKYKLERLSKRLEIEARTAETSKEKKTQTADMQEQLEQLKQLQSFLSLLFSDLDQIEIKDSWSGAIGFLEDFLCRFFVDGEERKEIINILRPLQSLDDLEKEVDLISVREQVREVLQENFLSRKKYQKDGITIIPLQSAQSLRFQVVFIPGLLENKYPAPFRQDPLLLDEERKIMGNKIFLKRDDLELQAFSFADAVNCAAEKLILSYPRGDSRSNKERSPSPYLLKVGEALTGEIHGPAEIHKIPGFQFISSSFIPSEEKVLSTREYDFLLLNRECREVLNDYFSQKYPWFQAAREAFQNRGLPEFTSAEGLFRGEEARSILAEDYSPWKGTVSISYLDDYISCPHYFLCKRLLGVVPMEEPEEMRRIDHQSKGLLMHRILEVFFRRGAYLFPLVPSKISEARHIMEEVLVSCFKEAEAEGLTGYPLYWEVDRANIRSDMLGFLDYEAECPPEGNPRYFELSFGGRAPEKLRRDIFGEKIETESGNKAVVSLPVENEHDIYLKGRIDRIDLLPEEAVRVIDYKTGKVRVKEKTLKEGISLQLAGYIIAAKELLQLKDIQEIDALYYYVTRQEEYKKVEATGRDLAAKIPFLQKVLEVICRGILEGKFFPYPADNGDRCSWCEYRVICGKDVEEVFRYKASDPLIADFLEVEGFVTRG